MANTEIIKQIVTSKPKNLLIGAASGYTWDQVKYWINSFKKTGSDAEVVLLMSNVTKDTIEKVRAAGVTVNPYGKQNADGSWELAESSIPHVDRFFYLWAYLANLNPTEHQYVICTDVRDVIFQSDPFKKLEEVVWADDFGMIASAEGLTYENEPWGRANFSQAFGPLFYEIMKSKMIYNVGTLGGHFTVIRDLLLMIFQMSINRPIKIVDQAVYNFLLNVDTFERNVYETYSHHAWAVQLGTTIEAVKAGAGELGQVCINNPTELAAYQLNFQDDQPEFLEDGTVVNADGIPFTIVHQYDRIPELKEKIEKVYSADVPHN